MVDSLSRAGAPALLIQLLAIVGAIAAMAAAPPVQGRMMLVPLSSQAAHGMVGAAIDRGAALVGPGPWPGSLVVEGQRATLFTDLIARGVAVVAAPATGCGQ